LVSGVRAVETKTASRIMVRQVMGSGSCGQAELRQGGVAFPFDLEFDRRVCHEGLARVDDVGQQARPFGEPTSATL
jgi:hypothetical protein